MDKSIFKRHELKYLVSAGQREFIESEFARYMIPDEHGESTICNIYYDTPDFRLIRRSLEKPVYKEKLRLRSYGTASKDEKVFLELKKKYKGIVYKRRISFNYDEAQEILENGESIKSVADLKGKKIGATGQSATPEYVLNYILEANGIDPKKDVEITYYLSLIHI